MRHRSRLNRWRDHDLFPHRTSRHCRVTPSAVEGQFIALASRRAKLVLPEPRGPENKYACESRSPAMAFLSVCKMCSCPTTSLKDLGRYFRYSTMLSLEYDKLIAKKIPRHDHQCSC